MAGLYQDLSEDKCLLSIVIKGSRVMVNGPESWAKGWLLDGQENQTCMKRQKGNDGVIFWAVIMENQLVGPSRVPERTKIDSEGYFLLFMQFLLMWLEGLFTEQKLTFILSKGHP